MISYHTKGGGGGWREKGKKQRGEKSKTATITEKWKERKKSKEKKERERDLCCSLMTVQRAGQFIDVGSEERVTSQMWSKRLAKKAKLMKLPHS